MQPEKFARGQPIFLPGLERLARLANDLKLIIAEKVFQRPFNPSQFRWNRLRLRHVLCDHKSAPHRLRAAQVRRRAHDQRDKGGQERQGTSHERLFGCVVRRQRLQTLGPEDRYPVLFCLEHRDGRIWADDWINARV